MNVTVRPVHEHEWRDVRALRLRALQDEAARIAFVDDVDDASSRPHGFWQQRAASASLEAGETAGARQFVAVMDDGTWIGSVTVIIEHTGDTDVEGVQILRSGGGIVGVYLDPAFRGHGIIQSVFDMALDWIRARGLDYARLYVHVENRRAQRAYEKAGFRLTGTTISGTLGPEIEMAREL